MKTFEKMSFERFYDRGSAATFSDLEFRRCTFTSCAISITRDVARRSTVRNVRFIDCEMYGCGLDTAIVEDVMVDGLKTHGLRQAWGAVYKHVTLRGKIGRVMLSGVVAPSRATEAEQRAFDAANAAYYANVDWALDIREAEFEELDPRGVPAHLVRRDSATQAVVTRARALDGRWRKLDLSKTHWQTSIQFMLDDGRPSTLLVAPKRGRHFRELLDGIRLLRDAGIAEPE